MDDLLTPLVTAWQRKIDCAVEYKEKNFQAAADEAMKFFNGPYGFMYDSKYASKDGSAFRWGGDSDNDGPPQPTFEMCLNRVAEMVALFGPVLYHRNPYRQVNPRKLPNLPIAMMMGAGADPMQTYMLQIQQQQYEMQNAQQDAIRKSRAVLLQEYLNYTPNELDLKSHVRKTIDEAIIKGMGVQKTELYVPRGGGPRLVGSFNLTVDRLVVDHDVEDLEDCQWMAELCTHPTWLVEREYGWPAGSIKGNLESLDSQNATAKRMYQSYRRATGQSNDLLCYWKIFSKMGMGARLSGVDDSIANMLEAYGDYTYLVIAPNIQQPLNLPLDVPMKDEEMARRLAWPIPFWREKNGWPYTFTVFHPVPRKPWPMSHLAPAMGELLFLNWAYSYLATSIATTSRQLIAVMKGCEEALKTALRSGRHLELVEITAASGGIDSVSKLISFIEHPPMNADIFKIIQAVESNFERRTGLSELMYGGSGSAVYRSAEEAALKGEQLKIRPDDMATKVEEAQTQIARKEALAARWFITGQDVQPILGPTGAMMWDQLVTSADPATILEYDYRIEAGSIRRPDKARDQANMNQAMQTLFQPLMQYATMSGNVNPVNALITDWCKANEIDPAAYLLLPPPMPMPAQPGTQPTDATKAA